MFHNKEKLSTLLFETYDDLILGIGDEATSIENLLTPAQKYTLIMATINALPVTGLERVMDFHDKFKISKEDPTVHPSEYKSRILRFRLLLEEVLELGAALHISPTRIRTIFDEMMLDIPKFSQVDAESKINLKEVLDALIDIEFVTHGAIDVFNLADVAYEAMEEVYDSNMSKLIPKDDNALETITTTVAKYTANDIMVITEDLNNGYFAIKHKETKKILKPSTYRKPNLLTILKNN